MLPRHDRWEALWHPLRCQNTHLVFGLLLLLSLRVIQVFHLSLHCSSPFQKHVQELLCCFFAELGLEMQLREKRCHCPFYYVHCSSPPSNPRNFIWTIGGSTLDHNSFFPVRLIAMVSLPEAINNGKWVNEQREVWEKILFNSCSNPQPSHLEPQLRNYVMS